MQGDLFYTNTSYGGQNYFNQSQTGTLAQMPGRNVSIDISDIVTKISESQSKKVAYTLEIDRLKSQVYVYGKTIPDTDYCYVILMPIDPIDATSSVITSQLIYITIISLIISTVISLFMSRKISKPIKLMNDAAKKEMIRDLSGDNKVKREEHLKVIIDETDRLTRLVNDMMDLSKIESGIMTINKEIFNFTELASSLIDRIKLSNIDTEHKIEYIIPKELYVNADKTKIEQVLYNLVINAIKHSGEGKRNIVVKVTATQKRIKVEVIDDGVGISKEDLEHIWDRYYKASESFTRQVQGSGLGLSIVKNILIKHSSDFGVISQPGKGSDFWFDLERVPKKEAELDKSKKN